MNGENSGGFTDAFALFMAAMHLVYAHSWTRFPKATVAFKKCAGETKSQAKAIFVSETHCAAVVCVFATGVTPISIYSACVLDTYRAAVLADASILNLNLLAPPVLPAALYLFP